MLSTQPHRTAVDFILGSPEVLWAFFLEAGSEWEWDWDLSETAGLSVVMEGRGMVVSREHAEREQHPAVVLAIPALFLL